jgi:hypothetical protein
VAFHFLIAMFRTELIFPSSPHKIDIKHPIFSIGSCFAQVFGAQLKANKFSAYVNPFGVIYNPASIFRLLHNAINSTLPAENTYMVNQGIHYNYMFHSDFSATHREDLKAQVIQSVLSAGEYLKKAKWLIITLGTAFCYEKKNDKQLVANCHKMPSDAFNKRLLTVDEIERRFDQLHYALHASNPDIRYIFTVSPVRHIKNTLERDAVSKATLRLACEHIKNKYPEYVDYFPSYEIMMDDLRDYRFYEADMIHPNEVAQQYIWEKFTATYFDEVTLEFIKKWEKVQKALQHKPFHPKSLAHQKFIQQTIKQLQGLNGTINVEQEIKILRNQLSH